MTDGIEPGLKGQKKILWWLAAAPFYSARIATDAPDHDNNALKTWQSSRFIVFFLLTAVYSGEGAVLFSTDLGRNLETSLLFLVAFAIAGLIVLLEGLAVRSFLMAGALRRGFLGTLQDSFLVLARCMTALASAGLLCIILSLFFYKAGIETRDQLEWQSENQDKLSAANKAFGQSLRSHQLAVQNLAGEIADLESRPKPDLGNLNTTIRKLSQQISRSKSDILRTDKELITLRARQRCERNGFGCFGSSSKKGEGKKFLTLGEIIYEKTAQQALAVSQLHNLERDLTVARNQRKETIGKAGLVDREKRLKKLRAGLVEAETSLSMAKSGRNEAVQAAVPYTPPGPARQIRALASILEDDPVNLVVAILWWLFVLGLELAPIGSAFALRPSSYAIRLRVELRKAAIAADIDVARGEAKLNKIISELEKDRITNEFEEEYLRKQSEHIRNLNMSNFHKAA